MERSQIPQEKQWNFAHIYATPAALEQAFAELLQSCATLDALQGTLQNGAQALLDVLVPYFDLWENLSTLYPYAMMKKDLDTRDNTSQALYDRAKGVAVKAQEATSFLSPEILALPDGTIESYLAKEPSLAPYTRFLTEILRMKEHSLDAQRERLLAMAGEVVGAPSNIYNMISDADMVFPCIKDEQGNDAALTHGTYRLYIESQDRTVRAAAYQAMLTAYKKQLNTISTTYAAQVKSDIFVSRARNYKSSLDAALKPDEVPEAVYTNLVNVIESHADDMGRYLALRKRILGVEELHYYDLYVPIAKDWDMKVPYEQAAQVVQKALLPMGDTYQSDLANAFSSRWIDVYETQGKRSGAYACGVYTAHPYVLLNYQESLDSIFTIAHEMGHAMHSFYAAKHQPFVTSDYVIFVAEVASTVNELLLQDYLIHQATDKQAKAALLNHKLESIRTTVYRQTLFAAFERESHRMAEAGEALTGDSLCAIHRDLNQRLYPGVVMDDLIPVEWARIPHFYSAFYVYQYATGYSAAVALSRAILDGKEGALTKYLHFLSSGGSKSPLDLLRDAGIDMQSPEPVKACMQEFNKALLELEQLL